MAGALEPAGLLRAEDLAILRPMERAAFRLVHHVNHSPHLKRPLLAWVHAFTGRFAWLFVNRALVVHHGERLAALDPRRPVILCANHLTFWDLFILSTVLYRRTGIPRDYYFPVRAKFFYDNPFGLLLNALFAGLTMYPPVFREGRHRRLDVLSFRILEVVIARDGALIGFHPEGTRNRSGDPYRLLTPRAGTKRVLAAARRSNAQVLPVFMHGLASFMPRALWQNWARTAPVNVLVGELLDYGDHPDRDVEHLVSRLTALAAEERVLRERV